MGHKGFQGRCGRSEENDTRKGIYVRHRDIGEQLVVDLVLFEAQDQEAIQKAWSALSQSKQKNVALEVDKQFQQHLSKIGVLVDEDDVPALRNEWAKGHMFDIIQASHDVNDTSTREFFLRRHCGHIRLQMHVELSGRRFRMRRKTT